MKKKRLEFRIVLGVFAALGWWGMLYPQLSMTPDTYRIVYEDDAVQESEDVIEWDFDSNVYRQVLEAKDGEIRLRSKLLEKISALMAQGRKKSE